LCRSASKRARDGGRGTERDGSVPFPGRRCGGENGKSDLQVAFPARSRPPVQTVSDMVQTCFASMLSCPRDPKVIMAYDAKWR
jgi:hypothetical protein